VAPQGAATAGQNSVAGLKPEEGHAVWKQAGANASYVYLPDRGLKGGGHFAMAQLDTAKYAAVFIDIAAGIEKAAKK